MVIALDSNIFIYHFERHPHYYKEVDQILVELSHLKSKGVTSIISLIELLSLPQSKDVIDNLLNLYRATPNLATIEVNEEIALETARLRRQYYFRTSDAIQLATALAYKADKFVTNDQRLKKFKELKIQFLSPKS